jgi:hypothetical protein
MSPHIRAPTRTVMGRQTCCANARLCLPGSDEERALPATRGQRMEIGHAHVNAEPTPRIARPTPGRGFARGGQRLLADNPGRCNCQPELWRGRAGRSASPAPNCSTITGSPPCAWTVLTPLLDQDPSAVLWALHWYRLAKFADAPDGEGTRAAPVPAHPCWTVTPQRAKIPAPKFGALAGAQPSDQRSG